MAQPLLAVEDLNVSFATDEGLVEAVRGVDFIVPARGAVALVGESGSGKTVISQAILGILPRNARITQGKILFRDGAREPVDLAALDPDGEARRAIRGARISIIFQEPMTSLSPLHTIGDQISEAHRVHKAGDDGGAREETFSMLEKVGFPRPREAFSKYPFELSGGMRQRAMIAMALICRPALVIADEPTTALDVTIQAQILKLMKDLQAEFGMAILFITHDLGVVANVADDMVVLYRGRVMERGPCGDLFRYPKHPYLRALLRAVPRLETEAGERLQGLREIPTHAHDTMRKFWHRSRGARPNRPLLQVEGLRKAFLARRAGLISGDRREILAVDDVSFEIEAGETFAIVGESGSGKTTVSKIIMRAITADSGKVMFNAEEPIDVLALDERQLISFRRLVQYIFQDPFGSLNPRMTIYDVIAEPLIIHGIGHDAERTERVRALMAAVGLDPRYLRRYPHSFSGGQRQRIGIARALALEPRLLICDEPVSALDVSVQAQILNLLKDLQSELDLTYLFISHNLAVVRYVAHRIGVMCAGRMVEIAPTERLFEEPRHPYTRALLAAVPEPDLSRPLDFAELLANGSTNPAAWPAPFTLLDSSGTLREVSSGHYVRMHA